MAKNDDRRSLRCSFCGKTQGQVNRLIAGNGSYICDDCVKMCMSIIGEGNLCLDMIIRLLLGQTNDCLNVAGDNNMNVNTTRKQI